jgi:hypothetical protein
MSRKSFMMLSAAILALFWSSRSIAQLDLTPDEYLTSSTAISLDAEKVSGDNYRDLITAASGVHSGEYWGECYRNLNSETPPYFTLQTEINLPWSWQARFGRLRYHESLYPYKDLVLGRYGLMQVYFNNNNSTLQFQQQDNDENHSFVAFGKINNTPNNYNDVATHTSESNYTNRFFNSDGSGALIEQEPEFLVTASHGKIELADLDPPGLNPCRN